MAECPCLYTSSIGPLPTTASRRHPSSFPCSQASRSQRPLQLGWPWHPDFPAHVPPPGALHGCAGKDPVTTARGHLDPVAHPLLLCPWSLLWGVRAPAAPPRLLCACTTPPPPPPPSSSAKTAMVLCAPSSLHRIPLRVPVLWHPTLMPAFTQGQRSPRSGRPRVRRFP
jgi:hypothetical protein